MNYELAKSCYVCSSSFNSYVFTHTGDKGTDSKLYSEDKSMLVFVLSGAILLSDEGHSGLEVTKAGFILLPFGKEGRMTMLEDGTELLIYQFAPDELYCVRSFLSRLEGQDEEMDDEFTGALYVNDDIFSQLSVLPRLISSKKYCPHYYDLRVEEIFVYMDLFMPKKMLVHLFQPLLSCDFQFKAAVFRNYMKYDKVSELAGKIGMSTVTFNRHFLRNFGVSASNWIKERRRQKILMDIKLSELSFTELAFKYGFSSSAYFTTYCRKNWQKTPSELRYEENGCE